MYFIYKGIYVRATCFDLVGHPQGFVILTQYCVSDKIGKNGMDWACGAYG